MDDTPLINDYITTIITYILFTFACQGVCIFGIVSNVINIMCFVKMGFTETINICLTGLAVSDLGCLITSYMFAIAYTPAVSQSELPFDIVGVNYAVSSMPHIAFSRVTCWITAIVTIERCLCVLLPLKVKQLITHRRMSLIIVCAFVVFISCSAPSYVVCRLGMKFFPAKNRTLLTLIRTKDSGNVEMISFIVTSFFMPCLAFIIVSACTAILVYSLQQRTKWRNESATLPAGDVSLRNQRVVKMVVMISVLFISCYIPIAMVMLAVAFEPRLASKGKYLNVGALVAAIGILMESINSSANILIYYHMSGKYKDTFTYLFLKCRRPCSLLLAHIGKDNKGHNAGRAV